MPVHDAVSPRRAVVVVRLVVPVNIELPPVAVLCHGRAERDAVEHVEVSEHGQALPHDAGTHNAQMQHAGRREPMLCSIPLRTMRPFQLDTRFVDDDPVRRYAGDALVERCEARTERAGSGVVVVIDNGAERRRALRERASAGVADVRVVIVREQHVHRLMFEARKATLQPCRMRAPMMNEYVYIYGRAALPMPHMRMHGQGTCKLN